MQVIGVFVVLAAAAIPVVWVFSQSMVAQAVGVWIDAGERGAKWAS